MFLPEGGGTDGGPVGRDLVDSDGPGACGGGQGGGGGGDGVALDGGGPLLGSPGEEALTGGPDQEGPPQVLDEARGGGQQFPGLGVGLGEAEAGVQDHLGAVHPGGVQLGQALAQLGLDSATTPPG